MFQYQLAGKILSDAFLHYPLMQYAFEGKTQEVRAKALHHLYKCCSKAASIYGGVILTPDQQGALIWLPGKHFPLGLKHEIISGMWTIPFKLGLKTTLRLVNHDGELDKWMDNHAAQNYGYIWCVGVNASARGKGHSRTLIEQAIADMRAQGMNEFWLKTEDPKNVTIYQKLGFDLMYETVVKSSGVRGWVMRKR